MADRTFYPSYVYGFARVYLDFQFQANGASNPSLVFSGQSGTQTVFGIGGDVLASITYSATGHYAVQLQPRDHYNKVIYKTADLDDTVQDAAYATCGSVTNEGSTSLGIKYTINAYIANGSAGLQAGAGRVIHTMLVFRNSAASNPA
jgi:hypothetical protein